MSRVQVDVAGAGILSRVLEWYWRLGGIVVGTSNRVPERKHQVSYPCGWACDSHLRIYIDMYDEGVQKSTVLPFLNRLKVKSPTISVASTRDWRRDLAKEVKSNTSTEEGTWHVALPPEQWSQLIQHLVPDPTKTELLIYGRIIEIRRANLHRQSVVFTYKELCETPLGPADYLLIASTFQSIVVEDVPIFTGLMKNEGVYNHDTHLYRMARFQADVMMNCTSSSIYHLLGR